MNKDVLEKTTQKSHPFGGRRVYSEQSVTPLPSRVKVLSLIFVGLAGFVLAGCTYPFLPASSSASSEIPPWGVPVAGVTPFPQRLPPITNNGAPFTGLQSLEPQPITDTPTQEISQTTNPWKPKVEERDWNWIVIHHTATDRGSVESIHESHLRRRDKNGNPWLGIGYHFVIGNGNGMEDGDIETTFRWRQQLHGAHAGRRKENQRGIGIVLVGNFEKKPPTSSQLLAVKRLVLTLKHEYGIDSEHIIGHDEIKTTACPGKLFPLAEVSQNRWPWTISSREPEPEQVSSLPLRKLTP